MKKNITALNEGFSKMVKEILLESPRLTENDDAFYDTFFDPFIQRIKQVNYLENVGEDALALNYYDLGAECNNFREYDPGTEWYDGYWQRATEPAIVGKEWTVDEWLYIIDYDQIMEGLENYFFKKLGIADKPYGEKINLLYTPESRARLLSEFDAADAYEYLLDAYREEAIEDAQEKALPPEDDESDDYDAWREHAYADKI